MGNSASNANPNRNSQNLPRTDHSSPTAANANHPDRDSSSSPSPGNPHRSLRYKKKSLELPDLASLALTPSTTNTRGRQKTAAIAIPSAPQNRSPFSHYSEAQGIPAQRQRPRNNFSSTQSVFQGEFDDVVVLEPSTHLPFPPPSRAQREAQQQQQLQQQQQHQQQQGGGSRGRQQPSNSRQAHVARIQELYDQSHQDPHHPAAPPSSPASAPRPTFVREVVRSSIPIALGRHTQQEDDDDDEAQDSALLSPVQEDLLADPVPVTIVWRGGGTEVVLARAGDDDWKGRQSMERESPDSNVWSITVYLRPGTHHVRFLVDGQWRVADDLPAAVDDQGSLANYVAVGLTYGLAPPPPPHTPVPPPRKTVPGQSFWSAKSADGDDDDNDVDDPTHARSAPAGGGASAAAAAYAARHQDPATIAYVQARWTSTLPLELIEAAREEEAYLAASAGQYESQQQQTSRVVVTGFVPAPNIPPAPGLPRHLDKLILNSRVGERAGGQERAGTPGSQGSGVGSGQGGGGRRERRERDERKEKEREREREKDNVKERDRAARSRRANVPPPPPPSEDGSNELDIESTYVPMNAAAAAENGGNTTTPHVSVPVTPTAPLSPSQSPPKVSFLDAHHPTPAPLGSRSITIDTANMPAVTDDAAVLPVPSHVVLHHLCTSAIKNGVLAVANTTRYRKKYLTTIYYKPT